MYSQNYGGRQVEMNRPIFHWMLQFRILLFCLEKLQAQPGVMTTSGLMVSVWSRN